MAGKRWHELSERTRRRIVTVAIVEGLLKIAALIDIIRRPAESIRGRKRVWIPAVLVVNSGGVLPIVYFLLGRRRRSA